MRDIAAVCPALKGRENVLRRVIAGSVGVQTPTFRLSRQILACNAKNQTRHTRHMLACNAKNQPVFQGIC